MPAMYKFCNLVIERKPDSELQENTNRVRFSV